MGKRRDRASDNGKCYDRQALGEPGNVVIEDERDMEMLKKWAEAGKENNTHIWMQINHPGKQAPKSVAKESVAPSAIEIQGDLKSGFVKPRELTKDEIKNLKLLQIINLYNFYYLNFNYF